MYFFLGIHHKPSKAKPFKAKILKDGYEVQFKQE
jgi:hypothetical protein